jgi:hypothetical protein
MMDGTSDAWLGSRIVTFFLLCLSAPGGEVLTPSVRGRCLRSWRRYGLTEEGGACERQPVHEEVYG